MDHYIFDALTSSSGWGDWGRSRFPSIAGLESAAVTMTSDLYNKLKSTALAQAHAYSSDPLWDPEKVFAYRTEDCIQSLHPKESIPEPFNQDLNPEQVRPRAEKHASQTG